MKAALKDVKLAAMMVVHWADPLDLKMAALKAVLWVQLRAE
jgi:hypothetical protein